MQYRANQHKTRQQAGKKTSSENVMTKREARKTGEVLKKHHLVAMARLILATLVITSAVSMRLTSNFRFFITY